MRFKENVRQSDLIIMPEKKQNLETKSFLNEATPKASEDKDLFELESTNVQRGKKRRLSLNNKFKKKEAGEQVGITLRGTERGDWIVGA